MVLVVEPLIARPTERIPSVFAFRWDIAQNPEEF